ncbi:outer membrane beta-barrel domain-containing protein [bacterium]|nr:outer membrane beta-barrel domain-containing protein [bacterium]
MWKKVCELATASAFLFFSNKSLAAAKGATRVVALSSNEISDIAPTVVQNRFFTKQLRAEVGASFGTVMNESYSKTSLAGGRLGLFVSEKVGIEYNFSQFKAVDSPDLTALRMQEVCIALECRSIEPSFIRLNKSHQLQVVAAPIYGKINLLDWLIVYSDLTFGAGAARVATTQGEKWAFTPSIGQRFYFSKSFSLRIDATDIYLKQTLTQGEQTRSNWRHNWVAQVGLSAFLNGGEQ